MKTTSVPALVGAGLLAGSCTVGVLIKELPPEDTYAHSDVPGATSSNPGTWDPTTTTTSDTGADTGTAESRVTSDSGRPRDTARGLDTSSVRDTGPVVDTGSRDTVVGTELVDTQDTGA